MNIKVYVLIQSLPMTRNVLGVTLDEKEARKFQRENQFNSYQSFDLDIEQLLNKLAQSIVTDYCDNDARFESVKEVIQGWQYDQII